ncbi:hypothetical protein [Thiofilum flexile]|uniref:hypothetical protein n=1 Tax=Thiofilum flexile TaxID=125627 RepID=UPI00036CD78C|nr:hypothetical protein [Thiofilum flexile]
MQSDTPIELQQSHWLFGKRHLILAGQQLTIHESSLLHKAQTRIPLATLQPNPTYAQSFSMRWLLNTIIVLALALGCLIAAYVTKIGLLYILAFIFFVGTFVPLQKFLLYTTNLVIFRQAQTNEYLLYLWKDNPNAARFRFFVEELNQRLLAIR